MAIRINPKFINELERLRGRRMFSYVISVEIVPQFVLMQMRFSGSHGNLCVSCRWVLMKKL